MLKIMCTYAHYVILGSRCKMASNHRVTDLDKNPVRISKDEAPTPLSVVRSLFISSLLFHLSRALLDVWRFSLFHSVSSPNDPPGSVHILQLKENSVIHHLPPPPVSLSLIFLLLHFYI